MITESFNMKTEIAASDNGKHTFEIRRSVENGCKGKGILIELYPTISLENRECLDVTTMHLLNHMRELGWGEIRIINLFSMVFSSKPLASQLLVDVENLAYIEGIFEEDDIRKYDITVCWGSTLDKHHAAKETKWEVLSMLKKKKLIKRVKQISVENLDTKEQLCPHPLYLGLRYQHEQWKLADFPLDSVLSNLETELTEKKPKENSKKQMEEASAKTAKKQARKEKGTDGKAEQKSEDGKQADDNGEAEA